MNPQAVLGFYRGGAGFRSAIYAGSSTVNFADKPAPSRKSLPIGVFDPPFNKLSLDEMLEKFASLGI